MRKALAYAWLLLAVSASGCAANKSYEWRSDQGEQVQACMYSCNTSKYKCYADCGFGMRCEMGCDEIYNSCLSACPGLTIRNK